MNCLYKTRSVGSALTSQAIRTFSTTKRSPPAAVKPLANYIYDVEKQFQHGYNEMASIGLGGIKELVDRVKLFTEYSDSKFPISSENDNNELVITRKTVYELSANSDKQQIRLNSEINGLKMDDLKVEVDGREVTVTGTRTAPGFEQNVTYRTQFAANVKSEQAQAFYAEDDTRSFPETVELTVNAPIFGESISYIKKEPKK